MQNANWIVLGIAIFGIILGIIRQIDWYGIFAKRWGNNPMRARVYIHFGRDVVFEDGEYSYVDHKYVFYTYRYRKENYAVAIPQADLDQYSYIRGRLMIHVNFGEGVTVLQTDIPGNSGKDLTAVVGSPEYPERKKGVAAIGAVELNASLKSKTGVELVNSIGSRNTFKLTTILLIVAIVAGAVIFFKFYQDNQKQKQLQQQQQQQQQQEKPLDIPEELLKGSYKLVYMG